LRDCTVLIGSKSETQGGLAMRIGLALVPFAAMAGTPALAIGLEDLAKVVLGGQSVLKKADETCPQSRFSLTRSDQLALTFARAAAEQALPISQFQSLDQASTADANAEAAKPAFCAETKKKKTGILSKIKKAGKSLAKAGVLGL
jgi:antitoxin component of RelBE/YafQ-DinJ toxin-antitoxin module